MLFDHLLGSEKICRQPSFLCSKLDYHRVTPQRCSSAQLENSPSFRTSCSNLGLTKPPASQTTPVCCETPQQTFLKVQQLPFFLANKSASRTDEMGFLTFVQPTALTVSLPRTLCIGLGHLAGEDARRQRCRWRSEGDPLVGGKPISFERKGIDGLSHSSSHTHAGVVGPEAPQRQEVAVEVILSETLQNHDI